MSLSDTPPVSTSSLLPEPKQYDAAASRQEMNRTLTGTKEIDDLTSQIYIDDLQTILAFGSEATSAVATCSDSILRSVSQKTADPSEPLLNRLSNLMEQLDLEELTEEPKGPFGFLKGLGKTQKPPIDRILAKYQALGPELERVYIEFRKYEAQIAAWNQKLQALSDANMNSYQSLVKYILAGEQGLRELDAYLPQLQAKQAQRPNDTVLQMNSSAVQQARHRLEQRVQDLRVSEAVSMQTIPMLQTMQWTNYHLVQKIHTAFLVTLPVLKQSLAEIVLLKRQTLQAQALQAVDRRANENLLRQAARVRQTDSNASTPMERFREAWQTIVSGISETRRFQADANTARDTAVTRLRAIQPDAQGRFPI